MKIQAEMRIKFKKYIKLWIPECDIPYWHVPTVFWEIDNKLLSLYKKCKSQQSSIFLIAR